MDEEGRSGEKGSMRNVGKEKTREQQGQEGRRGEYEGKTMQEGGQGV